LDPARGFLLTVATVEPRKGLDLLIEALGRGGGAGLPLAVVGPAGWGDVNAQALAMRAGLPAERLRLIGRVADPELAALYSAATAVVAPSRAEGFGLPLLEAMTLGVPVVATRIPALVEVAGGAARLVEPDADDLRAGIDAVVGDPALRAAMVRAGLVRAADFDWDRTGHRLWTLYAEITGNFRPS
ncbi:MAG: glycosyltransferase family 4 protein, partial [Actinomycetota bacterium]|nr:glycosyltransferase family 4 protein [Actinomycetota bacterium]